MATLWQFLILMCIAFPLGSALASARHEKVGPGGYALAIAVGLAVGVCCGWVMYATHNIAVRKLLRRPPSETSLAKQKWFIRVFYLAKFLWLALAGFLGFWLSSVLLRVVFGGPV